MPAKKVDFNTVRKIAEGLAGVEESTMYGAPALKVNGKLLACIATNKAAEPNSLVLRVDFERRAELIETAPDIYYVKDHYLSYPYVLVRLSRIPPDAIPDLLGMALRFVSKAPPARKRTKARPHV